MTPFSIVFTTVAVAAIFLLPRRWASVPLLIGTCYMTRAQAIDIGPFTFPVIRMLILAGLVRVASRHERPAWGIGRVDVFMIGWGIWMVLSVLFHRNPWEQGVLRLAFVLDAWGVYALFRVFCRDLADMSRLAAVLGVVLAPIAALIAFEKVTGTNLFAVFGGVPAMAMVRNGTVRAQGPFAHAILAGNIGAVCLPLMFSAWPRFRLASITGALASVVMVVSSGSTGPLLGLIVAVTALGLWPIRQHMRVVRGLAIGSAVALTFMMHAPFYYIMARIDLTGSSAGWHRSRLIEAAIDHITEWWVVGTDYTRHWMPYGVPWSPDHVDITNHYLRMGVLGGLPLLLLFSAVLLCAFSYVGLVLRRRSGPRSEHIVAWAYGSSLFVHAITCLSVSYFDQSIIFLYLTIAALGCAPWAAAAKTSPHLVPQRTPTPSTPRHWMPPGVEPGCGNAPATSGPFRPAPPPASENATRSPSRAFGPFSGSSPRPVRRPLSDHRTFPRTRHP